MTILMPAGRGLLAAGKGAAAAVPTWTWTAGPAIQDIGFASGNATFSSVAVNNATADTVVVKTSSNVRRITSVTIGGAAMTLAAESGTGTNAAHTAIWYKTGVAYTTPNIVATAAAGGLRFVGISVGRLIGATATPTATAAKDYSYVADPQVTSGSLTVPTNGFGLVSFASETGLSNPVWNVGTEDVDLVSGTDWRFATGYMTATGTPSISGFGGAGSCIAAAAWGNAWSPLNASTPAIWWVDASNLSSITKLGGSPDLVTQWNDLGTGAHNMTAHPQSPNYVTNVINGLPAINFASSTSLRTVVFTLAQPFMLVIVWRQSGLAPALYAILWDGDRDQLSASRSAILHRRQDISDHYVPYAGSNIDQGVTIAIDTSYHTRIVWNGASTTSVLNASTIGPVNAGTGGIVNGISLGGIDGGNAAWALIGEAFIIPNPTGADATNAAAYTLAKWGV